MNMTNEQMRIAIAEACGTMKWSYALPTKCIGAGVPDYLNDLNAMHEAEEMLTQDDKRKWVQIVQRFFPNGMSHWDSSHLTARQRAIAFIKTLNLESK